MCERPKGEERSGVLSQAHDETVLSELLGALEADNQSSVRHLLEWAATILFGRQPHLLPRLLLPLLQTVSAGGHVISHMTVITSHMTYNLSHDFINSHKAFMTGCDFMTGY